jgi:tetratricopeptide (TPR) repeat protein
MTVAGQPGGAVVRDVQAGRDIYAVGGDLTINVAQAVATLGGRVALAPPKLGDWGLVGREEDLERLHAHLGQHGQASVTPVSGLGGLGKTALALGYLATYGEHYQLIAWIDAERSEFIASQYRALILNWTGADLPEADAVAAARALLAGSREWLVIFDNATAPEDLQPYLPAGSGSILVTTRNQAWSANPDLVFDLDALPDTVVAAWLARVLPGSDVAVINDLATCLGGLPLAVVQALAYIRTRPGETAASYLDHFATKEGQREALSRRPPDYPRPVATTWDLATEALAEEAPAAVQLLSYLAYLDPDGVALHLIEGLAGSGGLRTSLEVLGRYGLVRASSTRLSVHRLVQDVTRWRLGPEDEARCVETLAAHLAEAAPDPGDLAPTWAWFRDAAPHVLSLTDHTASLEITSPALAGLANQVGMSLTAQSSLITAVSLFERALRIFQDAYGPAHPQVAKTLSNLGNVSQDLGEPALAADLHERALRINEDAYGPDHPEVAGTLIGLANARFALGEHALAVSLFERALRIFEDAYGPDHLQVASTLNNLGLVRQQLGEPDLAVELYERALRISEAAYGPDHLQVATTLNNLGLVRQRLGDHVLAVDLLERALRISEAAYGPAHLQVASTLNNLGLVRQRLGEPDLAVELYERALGIKEAVYGPDHPRVAGTLNNLAVARQELGEHAVANELFERALRMAEAAYGPDDPRSKQARRLLDAVSQRRRRRFRRRLRSDPGSR